MPRVKYAILEGERITNSIEVELHTAFAFPNAVAIPENIFAGIGDIYRDSRFYRYNEETQQEEEILPFDAASQALALAHRNALDVTGTMLELNRLAQEQTGLLLQ